MPALSKQSLEDRAEELECYIEELQRQKSRIERIEEWTSDYDFADFLETRNLLETHIEWSRKELQEVLRELARAECL